MFPVTYRFRVIPTGEVPAGAYFMIELPDQVRIYDEYELEKNCGGVYRETMLAFSHWELNCKLQGGSDKNLIKVEVYIDKLC